MSSTAAQRRWPVLEIALPENATAEQWESFSAWVMAMLPCLGIAEEGGPPPRLARLFFPSEDAEPPAAAVAEIFAQVYGAPPNARPYWIEDTDWGRNWRDYFEMRKVTERLWAGPPWETKRPATAQEGDVFLYIEPGQAFGTGQHATTRLCMKMLERHAIAGGVVLDAGAGSGILSIAALKLGFKHALCVEFDPVCEENFLHNAKINHVAKGMHFILSASPRAALPYALTHGIPPPDLLLCNMLSTEFVPLLGELHSFHRPLILSGFLESEQEATEAEVKKAGFTVKERDVLDEWGVFLCGG